MALISVQKYGLLYLLFIMVFLVTLMQQSMTMLNDPQVMPDHPHHHNNPVKRSLQEGTTSQKKNLQQLVYKLQKEGKIAAEKTKGLKITPELAQEFEHQEQQDKDAAEEYHEAGGKQQKKLFRVVEKLQQKGKIEEEKAKSVQMPAVKKKTQEPKLVENNNSRAKTTKAVEKQQDPIVPATVWTKKNKRGTKNNAKEEEQATTKETKAAIIPEEDAEPEREEEPKKSTRKRKKASPAAVEEPATTEQQQVVKTEETNQEEQPTKEEENAESATATKKKRRGRQVVKTEEETNPKEEPAKEEEVAESASTATKKKRRGRKQTTAAETIIEEELAPPAVNTEKAIPQEEEIEPTKEEADSASTATKKKRRGRKQSTAAEEEQVETVETNQGEEPTEEEEISESATATKKKRRGRKQSTTAENIIEEEVAQSSPDKKESEPFGAPIILEKSKTDEELTATTANKRKRRGNNNNKTPEAPDESANARKEEENAESAPKEEAAEAEEVGEEPPVEEKPKKKRRGRKANAEENNAEESVKEEEEVTPDAEAEEVAKEAEPLEEGSPVEEKPTATKKKRRGRKAKEEVEESPNVEEAAADAENTPKEEATPDAEAEEKPTAAKKVRRGRKAKEEVPPGDDNKLVGEEVPSTEGVREAKTEKNRDPLGNEVEEDTSGQEQDSAKSTRRGRKKRGGKNNNEDTNSIYKGQVPDKALDALLDKIIHKWDLIDAPAAKDILQKIWYKDNTYDKERDLIVFTHPLKTGGTSVSELLNSLGQTVPGSHASGMFGFEFFKATVPRLNAKNPAFTKGMKSLYSHTPYRAYRDSINATGLSGFVRKNFPDRRVRHITMVREPLNFAASNFNEWKCLLQKWSKEAKKQKIKPLPLDSDYNGCNGYTTEMLAEARVERNKETCKGFTPANEKQFNVDVRRRCKAARKHQGDHMPECRSVTTFLESKAYQEFFHNHGAYKRCTVKSTFAKTTDHIEGALTFLGGLDVGDRDGSPYGDMMWHGVTERMGESMCLLHYELKLPEQKTPEKRIQKCRPTKYWTEENKATFYKREPMMQAVHRAANAVLDLQLAKMRAEVAKLGDAAKDLPYIGSGCLEHDENLGPLPELTAQS